jgi:hypothetical protein
MQLIARETQLMEAREMRAIKAGSDMLWLFTAIVRAASGGVKGAWYGGKQRASRRTLDY